LLLDVESIKLKPHLHVSGGDKQAE
jgi:hypothetical protein